MMRVVFAYCLFASACFGKNIVSCDFLGQLGNQMFQVAATIGYALDHDCDASFPTLIEAINGKLNYQYILHRLNISPFPENTEFVSHNHNIITGTFYYAPIPHYTNCNVRLQAHFCSEKYFLKHKEIIQNLFAPTQEIIDEIKTKYEAILNGPTVAVHVRTYLPDHHFPLNIPPNLANFHWYYFINAMNEFPPHYRFLVFSDDMQWTKTHFPSTGRNITFIEGNPYYFDFYMMSLCDHQIISPDSTFSWWAAWLNKNPDKIVVISDLNGGVKNSSMICEGWRVVPKFPPHIQ